MNLALALAVDQLTREAANLAAAAHRAFLQGNLADVARYTAGRKVCTDAAARLTTLNDN